MKKAMKILAAVTAAAALACSAGCSSTTKWSFKTDNLELSSGNWIFNTYTGTRNAVSKLTEIDSKNTLATIDFDKQEVEGKPVKDWIYDEAEKECKRQLALDNLVKKYDAKVDQNQADSTRQMYISYFYSGSKSLYEKLGVSEDSFAEAYVMPNLKSNALFDAIYGKGGEKEVKDAELNKYFTENYITYYTLTYNLKTTNDSGESVDIDDETKEKVTTNFRKYVHMLNDQSKTTTEVSDQYKVDFEADTAPATSETTLASDIENADLKKELDAAETKVAKTVTINDTLYLIYKGDINDRVSHIKASSDSTEEDADAISRESVLGNMKKDEFDEFLDKETEKVDCTKNDDCLNKYSVMRTVNILKEEEKAA